jgi:hypothetical protein
MNRESQIGNRVAAKSMEAWQMDITKVVRGEQELRVKINSAIRDVKTWIGDTRHDNAIKKAAEEAMSALVGALKATDILIGISMGEMHGEMTYLAEEKTADVKKWWNVDSMRRDIDHMAARVKVLMDKKIDEFDDGSTRFDYEPYYKTALSALDECSDKLRKVEHLI